MEELSNIMANKLSEVAAVTGAVSGVAGIANQRNEIRQSHLTEADKRIALEAHDQVIKKAKKIVLIPMGIMSVIGIVGLLLFFFLPGTIIALVGIATVIISIPVTCAVILAMSFRSRNDPAAKTWRFYNEITSMHLDQIPISELKERHPNDAEKSEIRRLQIISWCVVALSLLVIVVSAVFLFEKSNGLWLIIAALAVIFMYVVTHSLESKIKAIRRQAYLRDPKEQ